MAEVYIIGQILKAVDFQEADIYCKWSLQAGSAWRIIEGESQGQTIVSSNPLEGISEFCQPLDIHFGTVSVQGWPKLHLEIYGVNFFNYCWPVGYGFVHLPSKPGYHQIEVATWKIASTTWWDALKLKFTGGGLALSKEDLSYSGLERYKLKTRSSGRIVIEVQLLCRNFGKFGIEF